jgi:hypothetical protein
MQLDPDVVILRQVEDAIMKDGDRVAIIRIEWQVGKLGPFVERIRKDEYTADVRAERLNNQAREHRIPARA